jgi:hypothetical protein
MVDKLRKRLGIDGAVALTFLARAMNIIGSTGTVMLIARFLSKVEQGYYYTLLSLVSMQVVFELGFSFVILQMAAHDSSRVVMSADGQVSGDPVAHGRLASILRLCVRWYTLAAVLMAALLTTSGLYFFSRHSVSGAGVYWVGPWFTAVLFSSVSLWFLPFTSFLEGCGHIRAVAGLRLQQAMLGSASAWAGMMLHHGLYSPALVIAAQVFTAAYFLNKHRRLLLGLLRHASGDQRVAWSREVWPFQWRIAVSWTCTSFTSQLFIPILFACRGPGEAGQMGMSLSITGYMANLVLPWMTTKAPLFGRMIARKQFLELDTLFLRTLAQAMGVFTLAVCAACGGVGLLSVMFPRFAVRMVPMHLFAMLVVASGANCVIQSLATLLRSFKREPFLGQSLAASAITLTMVALTARTWGNAGVAASYGAATAVIALPIALLVFGRARRNYLGAASEPHSLQETCI